MTATDDYKATAAKCKELAEKAVNSADRQRWLSMAQFWLHRGKAAIDPAADEADLAKL